MSRLVLEQFERQRSSSTNCTVLWLCGLLGIILPACNRTAEPTAQSHSTKAADNQAARSLVEPPVQVPVLAVTKYVEPPVPNAGYVGAQACAACHRDRVEECLPSSHFRTCRPPDNATLPSGFQPGEGKFKRPGEEFEFETTLRGDKPVQIVKEHTPEGPRSVESTIDLILGANTVSDEVYLSWHADDSMWELPIAWVYAQDCWGASGFDRTAGGDRARPLTLRCFECHNTWFQHLPGTTNVYRREDLILGVTCERCHGPGQEHAKYHQQHPEDEEPHNIVYPGNLPRERLIEVCTQCHSNAVRHKGPALSFRPGMKLDEHYRSTSPKFPEDDHVANQISYLRQSKCFQQSEMTCITCHDPHLTNSAAVGATFQDTCAQCHDPAACGEHDHLPEPVRDRCVECHMRKYVKVNVNFDLEDDLYVPPTHRAQHKIAIDPVATQETLLEFARQSRRSQPAIDSERENTTDSPRVADAETLERWLLDHWAKTSQECEKQYRFLGAIAAQREALRIAPASQTARTELQRLSAHQARIDALLIGAKRLLQANQDSQAAELFEQLLQLKPNVAEAHSRLGMLAAKSGNFQRAQTYLRKSIELDPDDQYGLSMLARLAFVESKFDEAAEFYRQADIVEPYNAKIQSLWGQSLLKVGRASEAIDRLRLSLQIDPRQGEVLRVLCRLLAQSGDYAEALPLAARLNELNSYRELGDLLLLAETHIGAGESSKAASVAHHAMKVASQEQPDALPTIESWLRERKLP